MIVAKPKVSTLFSLGMFIAISLSASGYAIGRFFSGGTMLWYHYALSFIFFPIGMGLLFRLLLGYRVVTISKGRFDVNFPSRFSKKSYKIKELDQWKEVEVKTISGTYKEIELVFDDKKKLSFSMQEHTDYPKLKKYLNKKCAKLKVND